MKKTLINTGIGFIIGITAFAILNLGIAFINWELNPGNWDIASRSAGGIFGMFLFVFGVGAPFIKDA